MAAAHSTSGSIDLVMAPSSIPFMAPVAALIAEVANPPKGRLVRGFIG